MPDNTPNRRQLRDELLRVRRRAGLSGRRLAAAVDINRGVIWRYDNGKGPLPDGAVEKWLDACGVAGDEREQILALADRVQYGTRGWGEVLGRAGHAQDTARDREAAVSVVRGFNPTVWPGLLQTPEYAAQVLTYGRTTDVPTALEGRLARQTVLYSDAEFHFLIGERVLRAGIGAQDTLPSQLDRARSLARRSNVTVRVVPDTVAALPWHNFTIWTDVDDFTYVTTELVEGEQEITAADSLAVYEQLWARLAADTHPVDVDGVAQGE